MQDMAALSAAAVGGYMHCFISADDIASYVPLPDRVAVTSPSFQLMSTIRPPLALNPVTLPSVQQAGRAGSRRIYPLWLCSSISEIPAVIPRLPSIWNGRALRRLR